MEPISENVIKTAGVLLRKFDEQSYLDLIFDKFKNETESLDVEWKEYFGLNPSIHCFAKRSIYESNTIFNIKDNG